MLANDTFLLHKYVCAHVTPVHSTHVNSCVQAHATHEHVLTHMYVVTCASTKVCKHTGPVYMQAHTGYTEAHMTHACACVYRAYIYIYICTPRAHPQRQVELKDLAFVILEAGKLGIWKMVGEQRRALLLFCLIGCRQYFLLLWGGTCKTPSHYERWFSLFKFHWLKC